jgi:hypothetical protein
MTYAVYPGSPPTTPYSPDPGVVVTGQGNTTVAITYETLTHVSSGNPQSVPLPTYITSTATVGQLWPLKG